MVKSFRRLRNPDVASGGVNFVLAFGSRSGGKFPFRPCPNHWQISKKSSGQEVVVPQLPSMMRGYGSAEGTLMSFGTMPEHQYFR